MARLLFAVALASGIAAQPMPTPSPDARRLQAAEEQRRRGEWDEARAEFEAVFQKMEFEGTENPFDKERARRGVMLVLLDKDDFAGARDWVRLHPAESDNEAARDRAMQRDEDYIDLREAQFPDKKSIRAVVKQWANAITARDAAAYEAVLSSDYPEERKDKVLQELKTGSAPTFQVRKLVIAIPEAGGTAQVSATTDRGGLSADSRISTTKCTFWLVKEADGWKIRKAVY